MPVGLRPRFLIEAGFLIAVTVVAGVAGGLSTVTIVLVMAGALLVVAVVEWGAAHLRRAPRFPAHSVGAETAGAASPSALWTESELVDAGGVAQQPPEPQPEPEVTPTPVPEPPSGPDLPAPEEPPSPEPTEPVPAHPRVAVAPPPAEAVVDVPAPQVVSLTGRAPAPREWNLWDLERIARDTAGDDVARDEERGYILMYLRDFASADGILPADFDPVVRESFGDVLDGVRA